MPLAFFIEVDTVPFTLGHRAQDDRLFISAIDSNLSTLGAFSLYGMLESALRAYTEFDDRYPRTQLNARAALFKDTEVLAQLSVDTYDRYFFPGAELWFSTPDQPRFFCGTIGRFRMRQV